MIIEHKFQISLDVATVPTPDFEDQATLDNLKAAALALAGKVIDRNHENLRAHAKAARLLREASQAKEK